MSGNVWEWCRDWYDEAWSHDPEMLSGMKNDSDRVLRGGAFPFPAGGCRPSCRYRLDDPADRGCLVGFRVALVPVQ